MSNYTALQIDEVLQIRTKSVLFYRKFSGIRKSLLFMQNAEKLKDRAKYTGLMSVGAKKRITKAIDLLISSTPSRIIINPVSKKKQQFKLSFITLTFPASVDLSQTKEAKSLLEKMLRHLRNKHNLKSYVWKAETQKNGQIHFHITADCYIHHTELRNYWNLQLMKSGLFDEYFKERGNSDINSTDIHSVRKVKDLAAYLIKYFTKSYQNEKALKGKIWDCSTNLKSAKYFETQALEADYWELKTAATKGLIKEIQLDSCTIFKSIGQSVLNFIDSKIQPFYYKHLDNIRQGICESVFDKVSYNLLDSCIENRSTIKIMPKQYQLNI